MKYSVVKIKTFPLTKELRKRGISNREFAKRIGCDPSYITRIEKGFYTVSEGYAKRIFTALKKKEKEE